MIAKLVQRTLKSFNGVGAESVAAGSKVLQAALFPFWCSQSQPCDVLLVSDCQVGVKFITRVSFYIGSMLLVILTAMLIRWLLLLGRLQSV